MLSHVFDYMHLIFRNVDTSLAPEGLRRAISGPWPKKVVHRWSRSSVFCLSLTLVCAVCLSSIGHVCHCVLSACHFICLPIIVSVCLSLYLSACHRVCLRIIMSVSL